MDMSPVPQNELVALRSLDGYDPMLEIDRLCRVYNTDEATIRSAMAQLSTPSATSPATPQPMDWNTSYKDTPDLHQAARPSAPTVVDKGRFRFEYDPTREAAVRREQVNQAILCSACGVALGIPDVRPIKVTCPSCLFEATYTQ
jgi:formylmethanofuran dehydrogenase subunit E